MNLTRLITSTAKQRPKPNHGRRWNGYMSTVNRPAAMKRIKREVALARERKMAK